MELTKHAIEEFSSIFAFGNITNASTEEGDLCYEISTCRELKYEPIFESIPILSCMHQDEFFKAVIDLHSAKILNSKKKFMSYMLSRCMKLSETPSLFSFLTVLTYIDNVVSCTCHEVECFKVVMVAAKCLTAVFCRQYVDLFDKENGFKGFSSYCEKLNATVLDTSVFVPHNFSGEDSDTDSENSLDLEGFTPPDTAEVLELLRSFKDLDDSDFALTDFETKLLYDRDELSSDIDATEDILIMFNNGSKSAEVENLVETMQNLSIKSEKVLKRVNQYCTLCEDNCYKLVVSVAKELDPEVSI